jgi:hypothetical protein
MIEKDESTFTKGEVKFQRDDDSTDKEEYDSALERVFSEPSDLETTNKHV